MVTVIHQFWTSITEELDAKHPMKFGLQFNRYSTHSCDLLDTAGHTVLETEQILTILNGLDIKYESVVAIISSQQSIPSMQYVHSTSLSREGKVE